MPWALDDSAAKAPLGLHIALDAGGAGNPSLPAPPRAADPWGGDWSLRLFLWRKEKVQSDKSSKQGLNLSRS